jgi:hypothetical protein
MGLAWRARGGQTPAMNEVVINLNDPAARTVGRRRPLDTAAAYDRLVAEVKALGRGRLPFPKGVYRFSTQEEADAWEMKLLLEAAKRRAARTSAT